MEAGTAEFNVQFYNTVREALPPELTIHYICLIGSQAKNLASADSDYDIRVIITSPHKNYVLQRSIQTLKIKTIFQGKDLEGTAIDLLKAFEYSLESNLSMIEILRGVPVYESSEKLFQKLKEFFVEAYLPTDPMGSVNGKVHYYIRKHLKNEEHKYREKVAAKVGVETIFLVLEIRCLLNGKNLLNYSTIDKLMEFLSEQEVEYVGRLVEIRRKNKNEQIDLTEEIKGMIKDALDKSDDFIKSFSKEETNQVSIIRENLREKADQACIDIIVSK